MTDQKKKNLEKHVSGLRDKLSATVVPDKHKDSPKTYREFLQRDLDKTLATLSSARDDAMATPSKK